MFLRIPEKDNRPRYRVSLDDVSVAIDENRSSDAERILSVEAGEKAGRVRTIRIFDYNTSANALEFRFVILPGFSCKLDKPYYLDEDRTAVLTVRDDSGETDIPMIRPDGSDTAVSAAAYLGLSLEADLPAVHAVMGEGSLFELSEKLWYASIEKSDFVRLSLPDGWDGELRLGETPIEPNASGDIELGNFLHSGRRFGNRETLKLTLSHDQNPLIHPFAVTVPSMFTEESASTYITPPPAPPSPYPSTLPPIPGPTGRYASSVAGEAFPRLAGVPSMAMPIAPAPPCEPPDAIASCGAPNPCARTVPPMLAFWAVPPQPPAEPRLSAEKSPVAATSSDPTEKCGADRFTGSHEA